MSFQGFNLVNATLFHFLSHFGIQLQEQKTQDVEPSESSHFLKNHLRDFSSPPLCTARAVRDIHGKMTLVRVKRGTHILEYHRTNRDASETFGSPKGDLHAFFPSISHFVQIAKQKTILDVGCGDGAFVLELRRRGLQIYGLDLCISSETENHPAFIQGDAFSLPFKNESFDLMTSIWSVFSYEPLARLRAILNEAHRTLKPDGILILSPVLDQDKLLVMQKWSRAVGARILMDPKTHAVLIKK